MEISGAAGGLSISFLSSAFVADFRPGAFLNVMKSSLFPVLLMTTVFAVGSLIPLPAQEASVYRRFSTRDGKAFYAVVVEKTTTSVTLKLQDGKKVTRTLRELADPDQNFIRKWTKFKDDLLKRFFSGYIDQPARFHVAIRRTHYFNDNVPDLDNKECFEITNAMGTISGHVFVPKPSPLVTSLASSITWDKASVFPIVELQWRKEPGYQWIEMTAVPQLNWYSANAKPVPGL